MSVKYDTVIVIGGTGQLGSEIVKFCKQKKIDCVSFNSKTFPVTQEHALRKLYDYSDRKCIVVNTAAYHDVMGCEENPGLAYSVNSIASYNIASLCNKLGMKYVYVSTDYCSGDRNDCNGFPVSVYAKTKLAGELGAFTANQESLIVRVGTLYGINGCNGKGGGNFIDTVANKILSQEQFTLPDYTSIRITSAKLCAERIMNAALGGLSGTFFGTDPHITGSHYDIGKRMVTMLHVKDYILGVSKDPNDNIRPHKIDYHALPHLPYDTTLYVTYNPLSDYLIEKGFSNATRHYRES